MKNIPIIFVSGKDAKKDKVRAFESGGIDYISKPFSFEELRARVSTHLETVRLRNEVDELQLRLGEAQRVLQNVQRSLPICSNCKSIRDDEGDWIRVERYFTVHSGTEFSHSFCPDCAEKLYQNEDETTRES